ncbi:hypothetical protein [Undibacterium crateris]|uniref:hypothetical protein n=1 Tax=Undibacterium crateris TaxID=2528175 RepID=UPI001389B88B|nr:hypothetical protein [Undibacterium crateris]NDI85088.1 hypothetical protein [Undibacterium crateris]
MNSSKPIITAVDIQGMVRHWLATPVGSYLGSDYGNDVKSFLQYPESAGMSQSLIAKMRQDIPVLSALPNGAINIYYQDIEPDKRLLIVDIAGSMISSDGVSVTVGGR